MKNRGLRRILTDLKRHPWLHFLTIVTVTLSLFLLGTFLVCYRNFEQVAQRTNPNVTGTLYLKEGLSTERSQALKEEVLAEPAVLKVTFKSKAEVADELQGFLGTVTSDSLPAGNLFPDVLEVELKSGASHEAVNALKQNLTRISDITEVDFSEDWLAQYRRVREFLKTFGIVLLLGLIGGCSFIIANFMGMRHQSRREEIQIVQLMGAQSRFVLAPFLWEGIIEGILGGTVALALLVVLHLFISNLMTAQWISLLGVKNWLYLSAPQAAGLVMLGILMAALGSFTVFLRFKEAR